MSTLGAAQVAAMGFALSATLIVAIGAQNAFVLRQGLRREHVGSIVVFCAVADALLMALGVLGLGELLDHAPALARFMTIAGTLFLLGYGLLALRRAWRPSALAATPALPLSRRAALAQAAAFTLLNPHVYLDTVVLVGTVGNAQPAHLRLAFLMGAAAASILWFSALGFGARALAPWFARPSAWRWLDGGVGLTMLVLAAWLALGALSL